MEGDTLEVDADGPVIVGKIVSCNFFKFEHPSDILPTLECNFKAHGPQKLEAHILSEHHNVKSAQNLFRELWDSQGENKEANRDTFDAKEGEIMLEQGSGKEIIPETKVIETVGIYTVLAKDDAIKNVPSTAVGNIPDKAQDDEISTSLPGDLQNQQNKTAGISDAIILTHLVTSQLKLQLIRTWVK